MAGDVSNVLCGLIVAALVLTAVSLALVVTATVAHFVSKKRIREHQRDQSRWEEGLLDVLAEEAPPMSLSDQVSPAQRDRFLSFLAEYATTVKGRERNRIRDAARPFLSIVEKNMHDPSRVVRARAIRRIGLFGERERADLLKKALDDRSELVAFIAFRHLAEWGNPNDARHLLNAVPHLSRSDRAQLVSALAELGEDAAPFFRNELRNEERSSFERVVCAETLRWLGDGEAAPAAADLLGASDGDPELTAALLRLLRRVGNVEHASVVRPHCRAEMPFVRTHATRALGQLGRDRDGPLLAERVQNDPSRWVALSAAQSLAELGRSDQLRRLSGRDDDRASIAADLLPSTA